VSEYDQRLLNTQTVGANMLHETRIGYSWKRTEQTPLSTEPSLQVAGYFVGGGSTSGDLNSRERDLEADDDVILTRGRHTLKFGVQSLVALEHDYDPDTFNGAFVFGGEARLRSVPTTIRLAKRQQSLPSSSTGVLLRASLAERQPPFRGTAELRLCPSLNGGWLCMRKTLLS
jgi:hypothetical protein